MLLVFLSPSAEPYDEGLNALTAGEDDTTAALTPALVGMTLLIPPIGGTPKQRSTSESKSKSSILCKLLSRAEHRNKQQMGKSKLRVQRGGNHHFFC